MTLNRLFLTGIALAVIAVALGGLRVASHADTDQPAMIDVVPDFDTMRSAPFGDTEVLLESAGRLEADSPRDLLISVCTESAQFIQTQPGLVRLLDDHDRVIWEFGAFGALLPNAADGTENDLVATGGPTVESPCLVFHHRTEQPASGMLVVGIERSAWESAAPVTIVTGIRRPLDNLDRGVLFLFWLSTMLVLLGGQLTAKIESKWTPTSAAWVLLGYLAISTAIGLALAGAPTLQFYGLAATMASYVALALVMARRNDSNSSPLATLSFHTVPFGSWLACAGIGVGTAVLAYLGLAFLPHARSPMQDMLLSSGGLVTMMCLALVAPWTEELLFRGVIYNAADKIAGPLPAIISSAVIFSMFHYAQHDGQPGPWLVVTMTGVVLSLVRWKTGSSMASAISHFAYNLLLVVPAMMLG